MGGTLGSRRFCAAIVGVFLFSFSSVGLSAHRDFSVLGVSGSGPVSVAGRWGNWSFSQMPSTVDLCQSSDATSCQPHRGLLAAEPAALAVDAAAGCAIPLVELSLDNKAAAANCLWVGEVTPSAHILTLGSELSATEPCAVPLKALLPDLGYQFSGSAGRDSSYFGSDVVKSAILR